MSKHSGAHDTILLHTAKLQLINMDKSLLNVKIVLLQFVFMCTFFATRALDLTMNSENLLSEFFGVRRKIENQEKTMNKLHKNQESIINNLNAYIKNRRNHRCEKAALDSYAYVTLVTGSSGYALGALALGSSLHNSGSIARRLCIITQSTSENALNLIVASGLWEIVIAKDLICSKSYDIRCNKLTIFDDSISAIQSLDRYIFIDADTYVRENLDHLFHQFLAYPLIGARNCPLHLLKNGTVIDTCRKSLSNDALKEIVDEAVSLDPSNFNSGLMLIYPNLVEKYNVISYASNWNTAWEGDQDPLNEIFHNFPMLPLTYNTLMCCQDLPRLQSRAKNAKMIHFSLKNMKPWDIYKIQVSVEQGTWNLKDAYPISRWWEKMHPFNLVYKEWTDHLFYALNHSIYPIQFEL